MYKWVIKACERESYYYYFASGAVTCLLASADVHGARGLLQISNEAASSHQLSWHSKFCRWHMFLFSASLKWMKSYLLLLDTHACKELHKRSHKFALQNFQEVMNTEEFLLLPFQEVLIVFALLNKSLGTDWSAVSLGRWTHFQHTLKRRHGREGVYLGDKLG